MSDDELRLIEAAELIFQRLSAGYGYGADTVESFLQALNSCAIAWKGAEAINKQVVEWLVGLPMTMYYCSEQYKENAEQLVDASYTVGIEIEKSLRS